ncbi:DUF3054 domain-containing protein [Thermomonospora umbrina]|uniref:DUF3054 family protein n=1 Tax=Thermomonospora umbrina TaxID=111806 RepID=A0A3D9T0J3_9ACTN|nr:DUF3054 domain-containing protein [Thermomonospora umbrina]REE98785.1 DUF3054 family protein [Thermomonospora umbrina]
MRAWVAGGLDVASVLIFVAIGRANHEESGSLSGFAGTAWPFLAALALGWAVLRAWREPGPSAPVPTGAGVWAITVAGGMLLRAVSGQGTAVAFVIVATAFLAMELLGWRLVARLVLRERSGV